MQEHTGRGGVRSGAGRPAGSVKSATASLDALRAAGLDIQQHREFKGEWYVNGTIGPFESADDALVAGVRWIYGLYEEYRAEFLGVDQGA